MSDIYKNESDDEITLKSVIVTGKSAKQGGAKGNDDSLSFRCETSDKKSIETFTQNCPGINDPSLKKLQLFNKGGDRAELVCEYLAEAEYATNIRCDHETSEHVKDQDNPPSNSIKKKRLGENSSCAYTIPIRLSGTEDGSFGLSSIKNPKAKLSIDWFKAIASERKRSTVLNNEFFQKCIALALAVDEVGLLKLLVASMICSDLDVHPGNFVIQFLDESSDDKKGPLVICRRTIKALLEKKEIDGELSWDTIKELIENINEYKRLGGVVRFERIDLGTSYLKYNEPLPNIKDAFHGFYNAKKLFNTKNLHLDPLPTNHFAEYSAIYQKFYLSDAFVSVVEDYIKNDNEEEFINDLKRRLQEVINISGDDEHAHDNLSQAAIRMGIQQTDINKCETVEELSDVICDFIIRCRRVKRIEIQLKGLEAQKFIALEKNEGKQAFNNRTLKLIDTDTLLDKLVATALVFDVNSRREEEKLDETRSEEEGLDETRREKKEFDENGLPIELSQVLNDKQRNELNLLFEEIFPKAQSNEDKLEKTSEETNNDDRSGLLRKNGIDLSEKDLIEGIPSKAQSNEEKLENASDGINNYDRYWTLIQHGIDFAAKDPNKSSLCFAAAAVLAPFDAAAVLLTPDKLIKNALGMIRSTDESDKKKEKYYAILNKLEIEINENYFPPAEIDKKLDLTNEKVHQVGILSRIWKGINSFFRTVMMAIGNLIAGSSSAAREGEVEGKEDAAGKAKIDHEKDNTSLELSIIKNESKAAMEPQGNLRSKVLEEEEHKLDNASTEPRMVNPDIEEMEPSDSKVVSNVSNVSNDNVSFLNASETDQSSEISSNTTVPVSTSCSIGRNYAALFTPKSAIPHASAKLTDIKVDAVNQNTVQPHSVDDDSEDSPLSHSQGSNFYYPYNS